MGMTPSGRTGFAVLACAMLTACGASTTVSDFGSDCVSHHDAVARASTWKHLQSKMMKNEDWGSVAAVRTQSRGGDLSAGEQEVVRVVDLLSRSGRRLIQVEIWRTPAGGWSAGVWKQCTD